MCTCRTNRPANKLNKLLLLLLSVYKTVRCVFTQLHGTRVYGPGVANRKMAPWFGLEFCLTKFNKFAILQLLAHLCLTAPYFWLVKSTKQTVLGIDGGNSILFSHKTELYNPISQSWFGLGNNLFYSTCSYEWHNKTFFNIKLSIEYYTLKNLYIKWKSSILHFIRLVPCQTILSSIFVVIVNIT